MMQKKTNVMIAGVGGASLGTEILKALTLAGRYHIFGCDISRSAYGLHAPGFVKTYLIDKENYLESIIYVCQDSGIEYLIPGGEEPLSLLIGAKSRLEQSGIRLVANDPEVIKVCCDKAVTFQKLSEYGFCVPKTTIVHDLESIQSVGLPCIIKPARGSGGSQQVFLATNIDEALLYSEYIKSCQKTPIAQEYIPDDEGEYSLGVLSYTDGTIASSIALRRVFDSKLSVLMRSNKGVISSPYSQGYIANFSEIRSQGEEIARAIKSKGPLNIQGRLRNGKLMPFEINPRFSGGCYLRAMAGINEVDIFLQHLIMGTKEHPQKIREGWYLRSLTELYVPANPDCL